MDDMGSVEPKRRVQNVKNPSVVKAVPKFDIGTLCRDRRAILIPATK